MGLLKRMGIPTAGIIGGASLFIGSVSAADSLVVTTNIVDPPSGSYGTRYVVVMWMETAANVFQRTFRLLGGQTNTNDLPIWNSKNGGVKTVDGVTGATLSANATVRAAWALRGAAGTRVTNGTYKFNIEVSNRHNSSYFVQGAIAIGATPATKTGVDSSLNSGSTYITNVSAVYTPGASGALSNSDTRKLPHVPSGFVVPADFSGMTTIRLISPNGRVLWQKGYFASAGSDLILRENEIRSAVKISGVDILEADFGNIRESRPYIINR